MAPKAFSKDYLLDKLDELWVLRENMHVELDWSYECRLDQLKKKAMRQLIDPHEMEKQRLQYEFVYTTCVQNLETSHENLSVLQSTVEYLCEQSPYDHPSTPQSTRPHPRRHLTPAPSPTTTSSGRRSRLYHHLKIRVN